MGHHRFYAKPQPARSEMKHFEIAGVCELGRLGRPRRFRDNPFEEAVQWGTMRYPAKYAADPPKGTVVMQAARLLL